VTENATPPVKRARSARAREPIPVCGAIGPRGGACRRKPGPSGHCEKHSEQVPLSENLPAQERFLDFIRDNPGCSEREAAERAGYRRRDFKTLKSISEDFADRHREARGYDGEGLIRELLFIAFDRGNASQQRAITTLLRLDPDFQHIASERLQIDGKLQMQALPWLDLSKADPADLAELRRIAVKCAPDPVELPEGAKPMLELLPGGA
jgi:hypothetical protein